MSAPEVIILHARFMMTCLKHAMGRQNLLTSLANIVEKQTILPWDRINRRGLRCLFIHFVQTMELYKYKQYDVNSAV